MSLHFLATEFAGTLEGLWAVLKNGVHMDVWENSISSTSCEIFLGIQNQNILVETVKFISAKHPKKFKDFQGYLRNPHWYLRKIFRIFEGFEYIVWYFLRIYGMFRRICQVYRLDVVDPVWVDLLFMQDLGGRDVFLASHDISTIWFLRRWLMDPFCNDSSILVQCAQNPWEIPVFQAHQCTKSPGNSSILGAMCHGDSSTLGAFCTKSLENVPIF